MDNIILHKKDILLNKNKLKEILDKNNMGFVNLYENVVSKFGLDLSYKGFMNLLDNRSSWKFLYAYAIMDELNLETDDIFEIVDIDIDEKIKEKREWKSKYQKK